MVVPALALWKTQRQRLVVGCWRSGTAADGDGDVPFSSSRPTEGSSSLLENFGVKGKDRSRRNACVRGDITGALPLLGSRPRAPLRSSPPPARGSFLPRLDEGGRNDDGRATIDRSLPRRGAAPCREGGGPLPVLATSSLYGPRRRSSAAEPFPAAYWCYHGGGDRRETIARSSRILEGRRGGTASCRDDGSSRHVLLFRRPGPVRSVHRQRKKPRSFRPRRRPRLAALGLGRRNRRGADTGREAREGRSPLFRQRTKAPQDKQRGREEEGARDGGAWQPLPMRFRPVRGGLCGASGSGGTTEAAPWRRRRGSAGLPREPRASREREKEGRGVAPEEAAAREGSPRVGGPVPPKRLRPPRRLLRARVVSAPVRSELPPRRIFSMARSAPPLPAGRLAAPRAPSYETLGAQQSRIHRCPTTDGESSSSTVDSSAGYIATRHTIAAGRAGHAKSSNCCLVA
jgi:hypothetical protein